MSEVTMTRSGREGGADDALEGPAQASILRALYGSLAEMPEPEQMDALRKMAYDEYELSDDDLRDYTRQRLEALLTLAPEAGSRVAGAYDRVMQGMPAGKAMRRVAVVQSVINGLELEKQAQLRAILPNAITGPRLGATSTTGRVVQSRPKRRWAFWRSSGVTGEQAT